MRELIVTDILEPPSRQYAGGGIISAADSRADRVTAGACALWTR